MRFHKGFTMIELMIVVVIVAVVAAIALPSYSRYLIRGRIPEATGALATKRVQMEQYFQDNLTYVGSTATGQPCATDTSTSKYFTFSCTGTGAPTATTYVLEANGTGAMAGFTYTVDQSNSKQTTAAPLDFQADVMPTACWVTKEGGTC